MRISNKNKYNLYLYFELHEKNILTLLNFLHLILNNYALKFSQYILPLKKHHRTLLKSPHVHKKSQENILFKKFRCFIIIYDLNPNSKLLQQLLHGLSCINVMFKIKLKKVRVKN